MSHIEIAKQSARGSVLLFAGNFLSTLILAVSTIIIARLLGPSGYGVYTLALVIPSIFQILIGFGVSTAITRYAAYHLSRGEEDVAKRFAANGIVFILLFGIALTLASFLSSSYLSLTMLHRPELITLVQYASILVMAQTILQTSIAALMGWNSMGLTSISLILQAILRLSIAPTLVLIGLGVIGALTGHIISTIMAGAVALLAVYIHRIRRGTKGEDGDKFRSDLRVMISYGFPTYAGGVISGLAGQFLTVILAAIAVNTVVGYYQAASNITVPITLTSSAITLALFPAFSSLEGVRGDMVQAFNYSLKYLAYIVSPIILFLVGSSDALITIVYGTSYSAAAFYLKLHSLSNLPQIIGLSVIGVFFNALGRTRLTMAFNIIGAAVLVVFAPALASLLGFGVSGIIYALLISNLTAAIAGLSFARIYLRARVDLKPILSILLASVLAYTAILPISLIALSPGAILAADLVIFPLVYLTAAPFLRAISPDDTTRLSVAISDLGIVSRGLRPILAYERVLARHVRHATPK